MVDRYLVKLGFIMVVGVVWCGGTVYTPVYRCQPIFKAAFLGQAISICVIIRH